MENRIAIKRKIIIRGDKPSVEALNTLEAELANDFKSIRNAFEGIRRKLQLHADKKSLKGDELVGWLGEIYGKLLLNGTLVGDDKEHDFVTGDGKRVSVKARKGRSWTRSSAIPKIDGDDCPTHLMFVRLADNYSVQSIWLFDWTTLRKDGRFKDHNVRGEKRSFIFTVSETVDRPHLVYSAK